MRSPGGEARARARRAGAQWSAREGGKASAFCRNRMKLTEELVLQRTKAKSLSDVRSLNMWGQDISDIDVLLRMPNVEVLSLSVNGISSLSSFRRCERLRELYLRKNDVKNLADIQFLAGIKCLKILWLSDNPCAESTEYRATVIQYLPNLEKLDNVDVTDAERLSASSGALMLPRLDSRQLGDSLERTLVLESPRVESSGPAGLGASSHSHSQQQHPLQPPPGARAPEEQAQRTGDDAKMTVNGMGLGTADTTSPHILYAVIALLEELDEDSLRIVKAEVDSRLGPS